MKSLLKKLKLISKVHVLVLSAVPEPVITAVVPTVWRSGVSTTMLAAPRMEGARIARKAVARGAILRRRHTAAELSVVFDPGYPKTTPLTAPKGTEVGHVSSDPPIARATEDLICRQ